MMDACWVACLREKGSMLSGPGGSSKGSQHAGSNVSCAKGAAHMCAWASSNCKETRQSRS